MYDPNIRPIGEPKFDDSLIISPVRLPKSSSLSATKSGAFSPTLGALQSISIIDRAVYSLGGRVPGKFDVEGYDPDNQTWVTIASFTNTTQGAFTVTRDQLLDKDYSAYSYPAEKPYAGFRLVIHSTANQENDGSDGNVNINQLTFNAKSVITDSYAVPSLDDLNTAGLIGASTDNYLAIVEHIKRTQPTDAAGLQATVALANAAIELLKDYEDGDTALTADNFAAAGLVGVDEYNLEFVVVRLEAQTDTVLKNTCGELQTIVASGVGDYQGELDTRINNFANAPITVFTLESGGDDNALFDNTVLAASTDFISGVSAATGLVDGITTQDSGEAISGKITLGTEASGNTRLRFESLKAAFNSDVVAMLPEEFVVKGRLDYTADASIWYDLATFTRSTVDLLPASFTTNTVNGVTVSASGDAGTYYRAFDAVDDVAANASNNQNSWAVTQDGVEWWQVDLPTEKLVTEFSITGIEKHIRSPGAFVFQGFDGTNWIDLDMGGQNLATPTNMADLIDQSGSFELQGSGSQYIDVPDISMSGDYTMQLWINLEGTTPATWSRIYDFGLGQHNTNRILAFDGSNGLWLISNDGVNNTQARFRTAAGVVSNSGWHQITVTVDNNKEPHVYVDGIDLLLSNEGTGSSLIAGQSHLFPDSTLTNNFIGKSNWPDAYPTMKVGEVRIWDKALTQNEIDASLVSPLNGDETALEYYLKAYNGTLENHATNSSMGAATPLNGAQYLSEYSDTQTVSGIETLIAQNGAVDFNNGAIDLGDLTLGGAVTLQAWVNLDGNTQSNMSRIFDLGDGQNSNIILAFGQNNTLFLNAFDGSTHDRHSFSPNAVPNSGWQHITLSISDTGAGTVYLNGEVFHTFTTRVPNQTTRTSNFLGDSNWSNDPAFDGYIGEATVWNRELTQQEIQASMLAAPTLTDSDLVAYLPLYEGEIYNAVSGSDAVSENSGVQFKSATRDWDPRETKTFVVDEPGLYSSYRIAIPNDQSHEEYVGFDEISMTAYDVTFNAAPASVFSSNNTLAKDLAYDALTVSATAAASGDAAMAELNLIVDRVTASEGFSVSDLTELNIQNVDADLLLGYQQRLLGTFSTDYLTGGAIQAIVDEVNAASQTIITAIANNQTGSLTLTDLQQAGIQGVADAATAAAVVQKFVQLSSVTKTVEMQHAADEIMVVLDKVKAFVDAGISQPTNAELELLGLSTYERTDYASLISTLDELSAVAITTLADLEAQLVVAEQLKASALARLHVVSDAALNTGDFVPDLDAAGNEAYVSGASARTTYSSDVAARVFDDNTNTYYHSTTDGWSADQWLAFVDPTGLLSGMPFAVEWVGRSGQAPRIPNNFRLEGTNDVGTTWELIERFDNDTVTDGELSFAVAIENRGQSYSGFRLYSEDLMNSASTTNSVNLTELRFIVKHTATVEAYSLAGINGVNESNLGYVSAYLRTAGAADSITPTLATLQARVSDAEARVAKLEAWQGGDASAAWTRADLVAFGFEDWIAEGDINLNGLLSLIGDRDTGSSYAEAVSALSTAAAAFDAQFTRLETYLTAGGLDTNATEQDYVPDYDLTDAAKAGLVFEGTGALYNGENYTKTAASWGANNVFDKQYSSNSGTANVGWHSSAGKPDFIGWKSPDLTDAQVLTRIVFDARSGWGGRTPKQFDVFGWTGSDWELIKEDLINAATDSGSGVSIDVSYDADTPAKAYLGFAIRIDSSNDAGGWVNLDELLFYTKPAELAFDATQLSALGFDGLSADQAAIFSGLAEKANFAALNTASALYTYLETISTNLTQLEAYFDQLALFAAGDDSQALTLSDYQALAALLDDLDIDFELSIDASVAAALDVALRAAGTLVDVSHTLRVMDVAVARYADATAKASDYLDRNSYTVGVEGTDANFLDTPFTSNAEGASASSNWSTLPAYQAFDGTKEESASSAYSTGWYSADNIGFAVLSLGGNTAGWDQALPAEILKTIRIWPSDYSATTWAIGVPEELNVRGYNPVTDQWELIAYLQGPNTIQWPAEFNIESNTPYSGFRLEMLDNIADHGEYDLVDFGFTEVEYITQSVGTVLSLSDYQDLGFGNVTEELVQALNVRLAAETKPATISYTTLKPIVDDVLAQEAVIHAMIRHESSVTDTSVYADAGLVGVNASNIDRINELLISNTQGASQRLSDMQAAIEYQNHQFDALFDFVNAINNDADNYGKALGDGTFVDHTMTSSSPLLDGIVSAKGYRDGTWDYYWRLFDGAVSNSGGYASDNGVADVFTGEPEGLIGIYDINQLVGPRVLESVSINLRNNGEITTGFWIQGYNSNWQRWENIYYSDSHSTNAATQTISVDSDKAYSGFRLYLEAADSGITVIEELWFNTKGTDLFSEAGIQGVNAYNVAFISAALVTAQASDATLFSSNTALQQAVDQAREDFLISEINRVVNDSNEILTADFYEELGFNDIGEVSRSYLDLQWRDAAASSDLSDIAAMTAFVSHQVDQPSALMTLLSMEANFGVDQTVATALTTTSDLKGYVPLLSSGDKNDPEIIENNRYTTTEYQAWRLFDGSGVTFFADNGQLSSMNPLLLGYQGDPDAWTRIKSFNYEYREETVNRTPKDFTLQGLNPLTNTWVDIQSYVNTSTSSDQTFTVTAQAARQPFVGYRLSITSANDGSSDSKVNLDALQFNVQDVVVDSSLFTTLDLPMVIAETSNDILVALLTDPTLDLTDRTAVLAAARAEAISLGIDQYVLKAGINVEAPSTAELVEAGFTDVTNANVAMVLEALASSQADGLSIAQAVAAGVQLQADAFTNLTENFDGASQIFQGEGVLFVPTNGTGGNFSVTSQWNTTDHKFANAFDRNTATFWANNHALSEANPEQAAWVSSDPNYLGVIRQIEIDVRDSFPDRLPAAFDVEGWNPVTSDWEFIQAFTDNTLDSVERFAVTSNKEYSGFRLLISASQKGDNNDNSNINVDEIRFVVEPISSATDFDYLSTDPTLLTYRQAGIYGVTINNIDRINAAVRAAINGDTTPNSAQLDVIVEQQSLIQSVVDADPSVEADQQRMSLLTAAADDLQALKTFASVSDYAAQKGSGTELTLTELSAISRRSLSNDDLDQFIQDFIHTDSKITSRLLVNELIDTDAHVSCVNFVDEFGSATSYSGPDKILELPDRLEVAVALDFDIQVGDTVELIIDGVVISQSSLSQAEIDTKQAEFAVDSAELAPASLSDAAIDLVVRSTDSATGQVEETQIWQFDWQ